MRLEDFFSHSYSTKRLAGYQKTPEVAAFSAALEKQQARDKVTISSEAKAAQEQQQSGGYFTNKVQEPSATVQAFKSYMDKVTGREPSLPKTPEERMEELAEKIKKLQSQLSDVMADQSMPDDVKNNRATSLNAQINAAHAEISELSKDMGGGGSGEESAEV